MRTPTARLSAAARLAIAGLATMLLMAACSSDDVPGASDVTPTAEPTAEPSDRTIALVMAEGAERERVAAAAREAGYGVTDVPDEADFAYGDRSFGDARVLVLDAWVATTDQRRDVLEVTREQALALLSGDVADWSELGGTEQPVSLFLAEEDADRLAAAFDLAGLGEREDVTWLDRDEVADAVAAEPGAFSLMPATDLRPGILPLIVDGHDPLRDHERESPLRLERWIQAADDDEAVEVLQVVGWTPRNLDFQPVSLLATPEVLPVRCTYERLARLGDYGAMFDGTRELLLAADVVVSQLDAALTDRVQPTACRVGVDLRAPTAIAEALADGGIDVMSTGANHHMDCNRVPDATASCSAHDAHFDTVGALEEAGILNFGSGENIEAARTAAVLERGGVTFAFLGYDSVAHCWYGATPDASGTAPLSWGTLDALGDDVRRAKEQADHVIVAFSWSGDCEDPANFVREYVTSPDDLQRAAAHVIAEAGGSLIAGNGPHIVQASESIGDLFVAYSLGNFIYDQDWSKPDRGDPAYVDYETVDWVILEAGFTADRLVGYRMRPGMVLESYRPELVDPAGEHGRRIFDRLWSASDVLPPWDAE